MSSPTPLPTAATVASDEPGDAGRARSTPRVLLVSQNCSVPSDRRVWNELRALAAAGYEVVAICPRGNGVEAASREQRDGVEIFRYAQPRAGGSAVSYLCEYAVAFWQIHRLARRLAGERGFDVVQVANPPDFLLLPVHFLKRRGARLIFDHHDLAPELYVARFGGEGGRVERAMRLLERLNYRLADLSLATNESYRSVALERGRMRPEDVFVVRSGPELARFAPVAPDPTLKRGRRFLIAFIGEMAPQDGIDQALHALAHLLRRRDDWHAIFAGDGPAREHLQALSASLGLDAHVEFPGMLADPELLRVLSSSDVCVVPDPKTPLSDVSTLVKIAEYMAISRPIVAYDLTESRATAGEAAIFVSDQEAFAEAIEVLLDDPQRREAMGRLGRERVESLLSWEVSRRELLAAYEVALAREPTAWRRRFALRSRRTTAH
jgi:glycosyltransferase involved in cell wall biosynthesis